MPLVASTKLNAWLCHLTRRYLVETALRGKALLAEKHATKTQLDTLSAANSRMASTSRRLTPQMMTRALLVVFAQAA